MLEAVGKKYARLKIKVQHLSTGVICYWNFHLYDLNNSQQEEGNFRCLKNALINISPNQRSFS